MKIKNRMIMFVWVALLLIGSGITQANAVEAKRSALKPTRPSLIFVSSQGGPGLACVLGIGCGNVRPAGTSKDGPGPMCFPGIGCGNVQPIGEVKDGPAEVCWPDVGGCLISLSQ